VGLEGLGQLGEKNAMISSGIELATYATACRLAFPLASVIQIRPFGVIIGVKWLKAIEVSGATALLHILGWRTR
jgi:hypothetical protein